METLQRFLTPVVCLAILLTGTGCATLSSVQAERGQGSTRIYPAPFETVWEKTNQSLRILQLDVVESNQKEGYFLAKTGISAASWGEKVAIFIQKIDASSTRVEVVSRKALATNIFAENWEPRILNTLGVLLNQREKGGT